MTARTLPPCPFPAHECITCGGEWTGDAGPVVLGQRPPKPPHPHRCSSCHRGLPADEPEPEPEGDQEVPGDLVALVWIAGQTEPEPEPEGGP